MQLVKIKPNNQTFSILEGTLWPSIVALFDVNLQIDDWHRRETPGFLLSITFTVQAISIKVK